MIKRTKNVSASQVAKLERRVRAKEKSAIPDLARLLTNLATKLTRLEDMEAELSKAVTANFKVLEQVRHDVEHLGRALDVVRDTKA